MDAHEIAPLKAVFIDQWRLPVQVTGGKDCQHAGVGIRERLPGAVDIEETQTDRTGSVGTPDGHAQPFLIVFVDGVNGGERGRFGLVIAGYHQETRQVNMQLWNWRGLDVINAHERDPAVYLKGMRLAVETVGAGTWKLDGLISHRFRLDQLPEALHCTAERPPGFIKAVITGSLLNLCSG